MSEVARSPLEGNPGYCNQSVNMCFSGVATVFSVVTIFLSTASMSAAVDSGCDLSYKRLSLGLACLAGLLLLTTLALCILHVSVTFWKVNGTYDYSNFDDRAASLVMTIMASIFIAVLVVIAVVGLIIAAASGGCSGADNSYNTMIFCVFGGGAAAVLAGAYYGFLALID